MSSFLADTNIWSLAYRSDTDPAHAHLSELRERLAFGAVVTTGVVWLELLRGFTRQATRDQIDRDFAALGFVEPTRDDYRSAADLSWMCRRSGVQLGAIDALIAQLCILHEFTLLTADGDFTHAASYIPLKVWSPA